MYFQAFRGPGRAQCYFLCCADLCAFWGAGKHAFCFGVEETCVRFGGLEERSGGGCATGGP